MTGIAPIGTFFLNAYMKVVECGYSPEIEYVRNIKPFSDQTVEDFIREYVWVILNCGFKEQYARIIFDRFWDEVNGVTHNEEDPFQTIKNKKKRKAIIDCFARSADWFSEIQSKETTETQIEAIRSLPWMGGEALGYHLARNLGIDTVKPDRHMKKLAEHFGFSSPLEMCKEIRTMINGDSGGNAYLMDEKLGTIDVILWRYMNLTGGKINAEI